MKKKKLYIAEWLTFAYILITFFYLLVLFPKVHHHALFFGSRMTVISAIGFLVLITHKLQLPRVEVFRQFLPLLLLGYWYTETYYFSDMLLTNKDLYFYTLDEQLFGCQPSLIFSKLLPQAWFSELMYFGYFFFYVFLIVATFWFWFRKSEHFDRIVFVLMLSFFLYYSIYDLLPVVGPQFFLSEKDVQVPDGYFFSWLVRFIQTNWENPTGSFPSSHVGITVVLLMLVFKNERKLFWAFFPMAIVIMFSTVYIKAHYLVDVFGGIVSALFFYWIANRMYNLLSSNQTKRINSE